MTLTHRNHRPTFPRTFHKMCRRLVWLGMALCVVGAQRWNDRSPVADAAIPADAEAAASDAASAGPTDRRSAPDESALVALIRVPLPIVGNADLRVQRNISQAVSQAGINKRATVVLEFWSDDPNQDGVGSQFERALGLARYLASPELRRVRTVAYLPRSVRGHAVLPVLACEQIIMHPDAVLGDAGEGAAQVDATMQSGYAEIADRRRTIPAPLALSMLSPELTVYQVTTTTGTRYALDQEISELKKDPTVKQLDTVVTAGELGHFTGRQLRLEHGLVSHLVSDRAALAAALDAPLDELRIDPSLDQGWRAVSIQLHGAISARTRGRVERGIQDAADRYDANLIFLTLDSSGGSPEEAILLANFLADLESAKTRTVGVVLRQARGEAMMVLAGCDEIVAAEEATLGGPGGNSPRADEIEMMRQAVQRISEIKQRSWSLLTGMLDPQCDVFAFQSGQIRRYFCQEEFAQQADADRWTRGERVGEANQQISLSGIQAERMGLVRFTAIHPDDLNSLYRLDEPPTPIRQGWAHELIEQLAAPHIAGVLLFFAGFALVAELMSPGLGAGGFIAAVCFVLYFWSQFLNGTADWLEVLLFLTGVACLAAELLVIPGFGIFGVGGLALIMASLILASQTFVFPRNEYQLRQMPYSLLGVLGVTTGTMVGMFVLRRYIDRAPVLRRVMLHPLTADELVERDRREAMVDFTHLIGRTGCTTTPLNPSGKAKFGEELVDVVSDGIAIDCGVDVRVIEALGNRIVVCES